MSKTAEDWKLAGNEAVKTGDHATAYEKYSKGLEVEPDHAIILSNRSLSLMKLGRLEEAATDAQRCTVLRPDFMKGFLRGAMALQQLGRPVEAYELLKKSPKNPEIEELAAKVKPEAEAAEKKRIASLGGAERRKEEGNALFKKGMFEKALEEYSAALKLCKDPTEEMALAIRNNRAGCYSQLSNFHAVVEEANFVLEHQPDNAKALLRRMLALEPLEKYEAAIADARKVLQTAPGNEAANKLQHRLSKIVRDQQRQGGA
jgi:stress-induced-phosphoprotein 1